MSRIVDVLTTAIIWGREGAPMGDIVNKLKELDECCVKVWREDDSVRLPSYAREGDACMDVYVHSIERKVDGRVVYHTGLHFALPDDYEMEIRPRSSNTKTMAVMQNSPGTLDSRYRGELMIVQRDMADPLICNPAYDVGDRCAQILVRRRERIMWDEVGSIDELGRSKRGEGGFGSSGK